MELQNDTGAPAQILVLPDKDGYETLIVVAKATYVWNGDRVTRAEEPLEITQADVYYGKENETSVKLESDLALWKPGTDVVVLGQAYAPKGKAKESKVSVRVGPALQMARVFGDRRFGITLGFVRIIGPEPFEAMPLRWERAFGGRQRGKGESWIGADERNPVGTGYVAKKRRSFVDGLALPNFEHPKKLIKKPGQKPPPIGFGFVGRSWMPRRTYMGTYDAAWERDRLPLLPVDFEDRSFLGAPEGLQVTPHLKGGEPVLLEGLSPRGPIRFALPTARPSMSVNWKGAWEPLDCVLDTVVIEPDESRLSLTYRGRLRIHNQVRKVRAIKIEGLS